MFCPVSTYIGVIGGTALRTIFVLHITLEQSSQYVPDKRRLAEIAEHHHIKYAVVHLGIGGERHRITPVRSVRHQHHKRLHPNGSAVEHQGNVPWAELEECADYVYQAHVIALVHAIQY